MPEGCEGRSQLEFWRPEADKTSGNDKQQFVLEVVQYNVHTSRFVVQNADISGQANYYD